MFVAALCESGLCRLLYNRISIEFANKPVHAPNDNAIKNQSIHYHYSSNRTVLIVGCLLQTHLSLNNFIDQVTSFEQPLLSQVLYTMHRLLSTSFINLFIRSFSWLHALSINYIYTILSLSLSNCLSTTFSVFVEQYTHNVSKGQSLNTFYS